MQCPTDGTVLVMSERSGIEIDYCPTCRGVWLDRGELDKILERSLTQPGPAAAAPPPQSGGYDRAATSSADQQATSSSPTGRRRRAGSASCSTEPTWAHASRDARSRAAGPSTCPRPLGRPDAHPFLVPATEEDPQVGMGGPQGSDGVAHGGDVVRGRHAEDDGVGTLAVQRDHPALGGQVAADVHDVEPGPPQHRREGEHAQLVSRAAGEADHDPRRALGRRQRVEDGGEPPVHGGADEVLARDRDRAGVPGVRRAGAAPASASRRPPPRTSRPRRPGRGSPLSRAPSNCSAARASASMSPLSGAGSGPSRFGSGSGAPPVVPDFTCSAASRGDQPASTSARIAESRRTAASSYTPIARRAPAGDDDLVAPLPHPQRRGRDAGHRRRVLHGVHPGSLGQT